MLTKKQDNFAARIALGDKPTTAAKKAYNFTQRQSALTHAKKLLLKPDIKQEIAEYTVKLHELKPLAIQELELGLKEKVNKSMSWAEKHLFVKTALNPDGSSDTELPVFKLVISKRDS